MADPTRPLGYLPPTKPRLQKERPVVQIAVLTQPAAYYPVHRTAPLASAGSSRPWCQTFAHSGPTALLIHTCWHTPPHAMHLHSPDGPSNLQATPAGNMYPVKPYCPTPTPLAVHTLRRTALVVSAQCRSPRLAMLSYPHGTADTYSGRTTRAPRAPSVNIAAPVV